MRIKSGNRKLSRHFRWTRAIFAGPAPFLLTRDPRHIDYPEIPMQR
jgi:hypothetical protein